MRTSARTRYAGYRFPAEMIGHAVWLYFRFPLGLRMVEELLRMSMCSGPSKAEPFLRSAPDHPNSKGPPSSLVQLRAAANSRGARDTRPRADLAENRF